MSKKLSLLTKNIALGALYALNANSASVEESIFADIKEQVGNDNRKMESFAVKNQNLELKLRLKPSTNPDKWEFFAHRSHRSHSSHSSHRSHYSSRINKTYTPSGSGNSSSSSTGTATYPNNNINPSINSTSGYTLGSRMLKIGMQGEDVTELIKLLIAKGYYTLPDGHTLKVKELFDIIVQDAIKKFQKDQHITVDGIVGPTTLYHLKYK